MSFDSSTVSVLIVDPHTLLRDLLRFLLGESREFECVGSFADHASLLEVSRRLTPNLAVIGIKENDEAAFGAVSKLRREVPMTGIVVVARTVCDADLRRALDTQVFGLVHQSGGFGEIREALRLVHAGRHYYSKAFLDRIDPAVNDFDPGQPTKTRSDLLSPRERQLLRVLAIGTSLRVACEELGISYKTADKQKVSLMKKLAIHDRVSLARFAIREGIVEA